VSCARCHDHKFDPILTKDYYALAGVFASTTAAPRPIADMGKENEQKFMFASQRIFYLSYMANLMNNEPGSKPEEAAKKSAQFTEEMLKVRASMEYLKETNPAAVAYLDSLVRVPRTKPASATPPPADPAPAPVPPPAAQRGRRPGASDLPFMQSVFEAGIWIDGSDPDLTKIDIRPGVARDMNILPHANVSNPGPVVPRQYLTVLSKGDTTFKQGSGRLEFADDIFTQSGPLAARVIVNRVWGWHFGKPLVATESDFGVQGDKPTHPELLDDLAARFLANGMSFKWLHREIMLSAAYRQSSHPRAEGVASDPTNSLLWRMNPRRLDIEAFRDNLLQVSADLESKAPRAFARSGCGGQSRADGVWPGQPWTPEYAAGALRFPRPDDDGPAARADYFAVAAAIRDEQSFHAGTRGSPGEPRERDAGSGGEGSRHVPLRSGSRPNIAELDAALSYLNKGTLAQFAQALLASNEVIFWP
jgi:hypothetical protein